MNKEEPQLPQQQESIDGFDQHYDVILTGTDLTSSVLSAALARIRKTVLHLDSDKHYGKEWRMMKLTDLLLWKLNIEKQKKESESSSSSSLIDQSKIDTGKNEKFFHCKRSILFENIEIEFNLFENADYYHKFFSYILKNKFSNEFVENFIENCFKKLQIIDSYDEGLELINKFKENYPEMNRIENMFIFDLCPRLLVSNEKMVQILIDSTVSGYIEFKKVSRLLTPMIITKTSNKNDADADDESRIDEKYEIAEVPCTRKDIFTSNIILPIEKRYLMSFLEKCYRLERNIGWYESYSDKPFEEFLQTQTLTDKLQKIIKNTLLMISEPISTSDALKKINLFLHSFGRFCDRPFLFPLYGSEDLIQAFCRYGAVWGGLYCLGVQIHGFVLDSEKNQCKAVLVNQSRIECDYLVTDYQIPDLINLNNNTNQRKSMSRAIILNTKSIKTIDPENEFGDLSFIHLPPDFTNHQKSVYCFESDYTSRVCPKNFYLQYFWCDSIKSTAKLDLEPIIEKLFSLEKEEGEESQIKTTINDELPDELSRKVLLKIYYNTYQEIPSFGEDDDSSLPSNIKLISPPINEINYKNAIEEAERIFRMICTNGEEFFPPTESPFNEI